MGKEFKVYSNLGLCGMEDNLVSYYIIFWYILMHSKSLYMKTYWYCISLNRSWVIVNYNSISTAHTT